MKGNEAFPRETEASRGESGEAGGWAPLSFQLLKPQPVAAPDTEGCSGTLCGTETRVTTSATRALASAVAREGLKIQERQNEAEVADGISGVT